MMHQQRPTQYTPELGQLICDKIATGTVSLAKLCCRKGMPYHSTVLHWLNEDDKKYFLHNYQRARELQAELLSDEIIEIADDAQGAKERAIDVSRARLRIDARKWKAGKLLPAKSGDKKADSNRDGALYADVIEWGGKLIAL